MPEPDPCALAQELRTARHSLLTGKRAVKVRFRSGGGAERETSYAIADMAALDAEIRRQELACDAAQGRRPRRFAITAG